MTERVAVRSTEPPADVPPLAADTFKLAGIDLYIRRSAPTVTFCFLSDDFLRSHQVMSVRMAREIVAWAAAGNVKITVRLGSRLLKPEWSPSCWVAKNQVRSVRTATMAAERSGEPFADQCLWTHSVG